MKKLTSKKDSTKIMLLASSDDDVDVLKTLWEYSVVFGAWSLIDTTNVLPDNSSYEMLKPILQNNPDTKLIMRINLVAGFTKGVQ
jgi:hypothetical protein